MSLATAEIKSILEDEIAAAGGTMLDSFSDGSRLYARTLLPWVSEVRPNDRVQGGVALRSTAESAWVHPYIFRQVCSNGQIISHALESQEIPIVVYATRAETEYLIREAVRACASKEAFDVPAERMRLIPESQIDFMLTLMPFLANLDSAVRTQLMGQIFQRFVRENEPSEFGMLNAVTSVARDTRDPELRWKLEELGGAVLINAAPKVKAPAREMMYV